MEPEESLGFQVGGTKTPEVAIPRSTADVTLSDHSTGFSSAYATPQSKQGVMSSSPPYTESPASFHTADPLDNDYQHDANSEVESPSSTPPADLIDGPHAQFYSDGRPRPLLKDGDNESRDSFEDGGYTTATQIPAAHFTDPNQPKLLLADEPVQPLGEKRPLQDGFVQPASQPASQPPTSTGASLHEEVHRHRGGSGRKRGRSRDKPDTNSESTPLLPPQNTQTEENGCCCIL